MNVSGQGSEDKSFHFSFGTFLDALTFQLGAQAAFTALLFLHQQGFLTQEMLGIFCLCQPST